MLISEISYSNGRHSYSFPRVTAMLGDGKTPYDIASDGDKDSLGACSVCLRIFVVGQEDSLITVKASLRRTNVATKLRLTYIKDTYVDLKLQYKACT